MKKIALIFTFFLNCSLHPMENPQETKIRVMTFNIRRQGKEKEERNLWIHRKERVENLIREVNPDFLGLQEPTKEQVTDLAQFFNQYNWFGTGRGSCWFGLASDEYNPIFYRIDRFELLASGTFSINPCTKLEYAWDPQKYGLLPRICTWGKFKDRGTGKEFYVYNTHLDHKYQRAQLHGLMNIMNFIESQGRNLPIILMGDFNTELTPELQQTALKNFIDSRQLAQERIGPEHTRTGWGFEELKKIDHILLSTHSPITVFKHMVIEEPNKDSLPSDHRPVSIDLQFK